MPYVSIIIPLFGPEHFLTACLKAIVDNTEGDYEVIVVDNGTGYELPDWVIPIRNDKNLGYAKANNQGFERSTSPICIALNVDTEVQQGWLSPLLSALADPKVVMAGPRIVHPAGDLQTAGIRTWHGSGGAGGEEIKSDLPSRDVDGVTGACLAIRHDIYDEVGGMCELYRQGYEDVDLCLTVREAGYRIRYVAESTIVHHESATGPERWQFSGANVTLMNERWGHR